MFVRDLIAPLDALFFNSTSALYLPYTGVNSDGGAGVVGLGSFWDEDGITLAPPFTFECWFWQQGRINTFQVLAQFRTSGSSVLAQAGLTAAGLPQWQNQAGAITAAGAVTRQAWHHFVGTEDAAGNMNCYIDALSVATGVHVPPGSATYQIAVGSVNNPFGNAFQGAICEVAIYPAVLTPTRINAHFIAADNVASVPVYQGGPVFPVSGGGGSIAADVATILASVKKTF